MFHCFNISKHIIVSVLFFIISISCFVVLCWIFENNCLGGGALARFFCPGSRGFALSLFSGVGNSSFQRNSQGFAREDGQAWNWLIQYCGNDDPNKNFDFSFGYLFSSSTTVQSFITIKWQEESDQ